MVYSWKTQILFDNYNAIKGDKDMEELKDYTLKQVSDCTIEIIARKKGISKALAKKLYINSLTYTLVVQAIEEQIDFLLGIEEE